MNEFKIDKRKVSPLSKANVIYRCTLDNYTIVELSQLTDNEISKLQNRYIKNSVRIAKKFMEEWHYNLLFLIYLFVFIYYFQVFNNQSNSKKTLKNKKEHNDCEKPREDQNYSNTFSNSNLMLLIFECQIFKNKSRKSLKCKGNLWLQEGSLSGHLHYGENQEIIKNRNKLSQDNIEYLKTPDGIVNLNEEGIDIAINRRIALFFQQCILVYNMNQFTFSTSGADIQIGSSSQLHFGTKKGKAIHKREAAHSSTIPTLIAHPKDGSEPFVYLKGGSSYYQQNSTIGMHNVVNKADILIDGNGQNDNKLRSRAINLINQVAQGELSPDSSTNKFMVEFLDVIENCLINLSDDDPRGYVLKKYRNIIEEIKKNSENEDFYDQLLGVIINPDSKHGNIIRKNVYQKIYDIIKLQAISETQIESLILNFKNKVKDSKDGNYIEHVLLKIYSNHKLRKTIEKLFGKTTAFLEDEYLNKVGENKRAAYKSFKTRVDNVHKKYKNDFDKLERDIRNVIYDLKRAEMIFRSGIFKDLRIANEWRQIDFCDKYKEVTGKSISQSWVSRVEQLTRPIKKISYQTGVNQRRKLITLEEVRNLSLTYGVDMGIFLPGLFTSTY